VPRRKGTGPTQGGEKNARVTKKKGKNGENPLKRQKEGKRKLGETRIRGGHI